VAISVVNISLSVHISDAIRTNSVADTKPERSASATTQSHM